MQLREDKPAVAVSHHDDVVTRGCAGERLRHHLGIDDLALLARGNRLNDTRRCYRYSYRAAIAPAQHQLGHRGQQPPAIEQMPTVIHHVDALASGIDAYAQVRLQRSRDSGQHLDVTVELLVGARIAERIAGRIERDDIGPDLVEDRRQRIDARAVAVVYDYTKAALAHQVEVEIAQECGGIARDD